jgi:NAD-dependent DNA ligase
MKKVLSTEIYTSWGNPFDRDNVAAFQKDLREIFGNGVSFIVENDDDGFTIKILFDSEGNEL